jgi:phosphopantothenoylcysteine decarboxylase/phosphopantothenate--cysteine ligase
MKEPKDIVEDVNNLTKKKSRLFQNKKIIITAGPTIENIDPVRYLSNRSSGMMGCEIANAFHDHGANVVLVKGPCNYMQKEDIRSIDVKSAKEMLSEVEKNIINCDIFVSVAAVSDFTAKNLTNNKIKSDEPLNLELIKNIDILKTISNKYNLFTVGFAAETSDVKANSIKKLKDKKVSVVAANKVSFSEGIDTTDNSITLYWGDGLEKRLTLKNKVDLAVEFVEEISNIYH